jgi:ribonucleoside-diphosphate reductase alpha chain
VVTELHTYHKLNQVNLFLPADVHKRELHKIHFDAWKKGLKSLYYCRSKSIQRAENIQ